MTNDIAAQIETETVALIGRIGCAWTDASVLNALPLADRLDRIRWAAHSMGDQDTERAAAGLHHRLTFTTVLKAEKCTLYISGEYGGTARRVECRSLKVERGPYAQHKSAVHVTFLEKGKRKLRGVVHVSPFILVLDGHGHPMPASMWTKPDVNGVSESRHSMCSTEWHTEFSAMIDVHINETGARVLLDERKGIGA
jgi:hypothetical protein